MSKVRLGFLGCGYMGQNAHLQNYAALDSCEIVGVTDLRMKQAEKVAQAYFIPKVYGSAAEMLADPKIDAIVASQPFRNHVNVVCDVLNAGKHILTEKPLCVYHQNGRALVDCAAKNKKIHMIANHKRSDLAVEYAVDVIKKWKASGKMGGMNYVRLVMPPGDWISGASGVNKPIATDEPYPDIPEEPMPAGMDAETSKKHIAFVNYYIHQVNLMRHLLGEEYKLTFGDRRGVLLAVESESGVTGTIEMATFSTSDDWQESALVCFQKGYVHIDLPAPLVSQRSGKVSVFSESGSGGSYTAPVLPNVSAMRNQAKNFIRAIKGEIAPPCSSGEAIKDLVFAEEYINYMKRYA